MNMRYAGASHVGLRRGKNEDRYLAREQPDASLLLVVADGMGGAPGGEMASETAIETFRRLAATGPITPDMLPDAVMAAHGAIAEASGKHVGMEGMGATLTVALARRETLFWAHVGDSRLYRLRDGRLSQLTTDHRFLESMIQDGDITREEAKCHLFKNMLDQCLGCPEIHPEYGTAELQEGDLLLLCTDGLHDELSHETLERMLRQKLSLDQATEALIAGALEAGGRDNITAVLACFITRQV
jgi:protein phosphatase